MRDNFEAQLRCETLADQYHMAARAAEDGDAEGFSRLPKVIKRGQSPEWYRQKAEQYGVPGVIVGKFTVREERSHRHSVPINGIWQQQLTVCPGSLSHATAPP
jgi:hypothetical protein